MLSSDQAEKIFRWTTRSLTLLAALEQVLAPRKARGQRYRRRFLLLIIVAGLASGVQNNQPTLQADIAWVFDAGT
jgi:uncharacterized membrane protein